jgi:hypothetical protein
MTPSVVDQLVGLGHDYVVCSFPKRKRITLSAVAKLGRAEPACASRSPGQVPAQPASASWRTEVICPPGLWVGSSGTLHTAAPPGC